MQRAATTQHPNTWSDAQRAALHDWVTYEDELANGIAMLVRTWREDPLATRSDPSRAQLWREYERALANRDEALAAWRDAR